MDAFANSHIPEKVGEFLWLTGKMSPTLTGKCKIAYLLAQKKRPCGAIRSNVLVHLFCFYYNIILPRSQHTFAEERVLADFQGPSGTQAYKRRKKPATSCSPPQMGRAEMQPGSVSTLSNAVKSWLLCLPLSMGHSLLFSVCLHLVQWRDKKMGSAPSHSRQPHGPGFSGSLELLSCLMQVMPLSVSLSIRCMTHLTDAQKFKDFVFLSLNGKS